MCLQVKSGSSRGWMVSKTSGGTGRPRVDASRFGRGAHDHGGADARAVRTRPRTRVRRGIHAGVLEARAGGMETIQEMGW